MKEYVSKLKPEIVIQRLKNGEILQADNRTIECIDGFLIAKMEDRWAINPMLTNTVDEYYFDRPAPDLQLEIGKFYKTRDDKKAYVFAQNKEGKYNVAIEGEGAYSVFAGGYYSEEEETDGDLVGLWEEEPKTEKVAANKSRLDAKYYNKVLELAKQGLPIAEVARRLGKSSNALWAYQKSHPEIGKFFYHRTYARK